MFNLSRHWNSCVNQTVCALITRLHQSLRSKWPYFKPNTPTVATMRRLRLALLATNVLSHACCSNCPRQQFGPCSINPPCKPDLDSVSCGPFAVFVGSCLPTSCYRYCYIPAPFVDADFTVTERVALRGKKAVKPCDCVIKSHCTGGRKSCVQPHGGGPGSCAGEKCDIDYVVCVQPTCASEQF